MIYFDHHKVHIKRLITLLLLSITLYSCAPSMKTPMDTISPPEHPALELPEEKQPEYEAPTTDQCIEGNLSTEYPLTLSNTWNAVNETLTILELGLTYSYMGNNEGTINAVQMNGDRISITLKRLSDQTTSIAIKSTQFRSCESVRQIQQKIKAVSGL